MMSAEGFRGDLNLALQTIAKKLDVDQTRFDKAVKSYEAVGEWLEASNSSLLPYAPQIYSQGSFLLGTVVKPIEGDYDLDFVCLLKKGEGLLSKNVFQMVGDRLKENSTYARLLTNPKNRCWRLDYAGDFHMDIIPAVPDENQGDTAIKVPDRELDDWTKSNPKGYWEWFKGKMQAQFDLVLKSIALQENKEIEEIEEHRVKTELQRAVQLMKRHRDIYFQGERAKDKPISIIITTLAGHVYDAQGYQEDLFRTLKLLAKFMPQIINATEPRIPNPTNPEEDFADKWKDNTDREDAFYEWVAKFKADLIDLEANSSLSDTQEKLQEMFGENVAAEVVKEISERVSEIIFGKNRFDVPHKHKPELKWTMALSNENSVRVRGYIEHSEKQVEEFLNGSSPLDKQRSIYFLAKTQGISRPYEIHWQVVNTGVEATNAGQLRGGFYLSESSGSHRRTEATSYTGMHWIEAFIVKNGFCVARSGEFVVNIK